MKPLLKLWCGLLLCLGGLVRVGHIDQHEGQHNGDQGDDDGCDHAGDIVGNGIDVSGNGIITSKSVTLEKYSVQEDAEDGLDIYLDVELKEYVGYGTQKIKYTTNTKTGTTVASTEKTRNTDNKKVATTYTVKKGDTLSNICKKELGNANKWKEVAKLNNLANANKIYPGQVLKLK